MFERSDPRQRMYRLVTDRYGNAQGVMTYEACQTLQSDLRACGEGFADVVITYDQLGDRFFDQNGETIAERVVVKPDEVRAAIVEALGKPAARNYDVIVLWDDGSVDRMSALTLSDVSLTGRERIMGEIFSFEDIDHDGDRYLYPDGSHIELDDEDWISETVADAMQTADEILSRA